MTLSPIETAIRQKLGVPETAESVLILGMDAHLDWDWLQTFQQLLVQGNPSPQASVQELLKEAWKLMTEDQSDPPYRYSVCEMGFLRAATATVPSLLKDYHAFRLKDQLSLEGGGITSPDNLLPHGEAFIRNYLLGRNWQSGVYGLESSFAYMPDDFGHDAQLPVVLRAMGFTGVSFSRLPGSWASSVSTPLKGESLYQQLMDRKGDFVWEAADGSTVQTHVLPDGYQQGNGLRLEEGEGALSSMEEYRSKIAPTTPTPYLYLACGNDFAQPIPQLTQLAQSWNRERYKSNKAWAVVAGLEDCMQLAGAWMNANPSSISKLRVDPTPYWTGFYASRPELKILHHATTQALLDAEVFSALGKALQVPDCQAWLPVQEAQRESIRAGWEALVPSTHHDYVTGTAVDDVTYGEQLPLLRAAHQIAVSTREVAQTAIASLVGQNLEAGQRQVAVFNSLGFRRSGIVTADSIDSLFKPQSAIGESGQPIPVQQTSSGGCLFPAEVPSFGYSRYVLSEQSAPEGRPKGGVTVQQSTEGTVLQSELMRVQLSPIGELVSLRPIVKGEQQADLFSAEHPGNTLAFFADLGNIYNFGNESEGASGFKEEAVQTTARSVQVVESGPWRASVRFEVEVRSQEGSHGVFVLDYQLDAGEAFLRMACTGAASSGYSVCTRFPFAHGAIDGMLRGTPNHWYDKLPDPYWEGPTFQATHHFVVPRVKGTDQAAILHRDVPAWAIDQGGAMIGCLLRNTPQGEGPGRGADGSDAGIHCRRYALQVPQALPASSGIVPLFQSSFGYYSSLAAVQGMPQGNTADRAIAASSSLVQVTSENALLIVAKEGEEESSLVIRLYQPSNQAQDVTLQFSPELKAATVEEVTALEQPVSGRSAATVDAGQVTVCMHHALATYLVRLDSTA